MLYGKNSGNMHLRESSRRSGLFGIIQSMKATGFHRFAAWFVASWALLGCGTEEEEIRRGENFEIVFYSAQDDGTGKELHVGDGDLVPLEPMPTGTVHWFLGLWTERRDEGRFLFNYTVTDLTDNVELDLLEEEGHTVLEDRGDGAAPEASLGPLAYTLILGCTAGRRHVESGHECLVEVDATWPDGAGGHRSVIVTPSCVVSRFPDYCVEQCGGEL